MLARATPDTHLDTYFNNWLPRQLYYHGDVNRLTTDPQTRNYLQDNMGMAFIAPEMTRQALLRALAQQHASGAMPDGILLHPEAELKYINQIPHTDHAVWVPLCLRAYLHETNDYALLHKPVAFCDDTTRAPVFEHVARAMTWLLNAGDHRGLSFIAQGDWCDPMNMVGYKGRGVSGWLTLASSYAMAVWGEICGEAGRPDEAERWSLNVRMLNETANGHLWDGDWFARGITDDGVAFGVNRDDEGKMYLNPQSWAFMAGAADSEAQAKMLAAIDAHLQTPYGPVMLAPPYTQVREDVGRLTQKFPGSAENGSVYNHAAAFYAYGLLQVGQADRAYKVLRDMITGPDLEDYLQRGQLPVFIPNYYRGAWKQHPRTAGRSSQLFNTGTVAWFMLCLVEGLFGLRGARAGLLVVPQLPSHWKHARAARRFRGATFEVTYERVGGVQAVTIEVDGKRLSGACISDIVAGKTYDVRVHLP